jgi:hypothetical protein
MDLTEDEIKRAYESGERVVAQLIRAGVDPEEGVRDIGEDWEECERKVQFVRHQFCGANRALWRYRRSISSSPSAPPAP